MSQQQQQKAITFAETVDDLNSLWYVLQHIDYDEIVNKFTSVIPVDSVQNGMQVIAQKEAIANAARITKKKLDELRATNHLTQITPDAEFEQAVTRMMQMSWLEGMLKVANAAANSPDAKEEVRNYMASLAILIQTTGWLAGQYVEIFKPFTQGNSNEPLSV